MIAAAKTLSEEKVAEVCTETPVVDHYLFMRLTIFLFLQTKLAALNLLETILSKMNGDIQRLTRICGPALSDKGASDLEEKWNKRNPTETIVSSSVTKAPKFLTSADYDNNALNNSEDGQSIRDELPSFRLDADHTLATGGEKEDTLTTKDGGTPGNFALSYLHSGNTMERTEGGDFSEGTEYHDAREQDEVPGKTDGTAASLRMRLLEIKEKSKYSDENVPVTGSRHSSPGAADGSAGRLGNGEEMASIRSLLKKKGPLREHDSELISSIEALKRIHAAVSKQGNTSLGFSVAEILQFRDSIAGQIDALVDLLTQ